MAGGSGKASAYHYERVGEGHGSGHGVAGGGAEAAEGLFGCLAVTLAGAVGYLAYILWRQAVVGVAGKFAVDAFDGADCHAVLYDDIAVECVGQAECLDA